MQIVSASTDLSDLIRASMDIVEKLKTTLHPNDSPHFVALFGTPAVIQRDFHPEIDQRLDGDEKDLAAATGEHALKAAGRRGEAHTRFRQGQIEGGKAGLVGFCGIPTRSDTAAKRRQALEMRDNFGDQLNPEFSPVGNDGCRKIEALRTQTRQRLV